MKIRLDESYHTEEAQVTLWSPYAVEAFAAELGISYTVSYTASGASFAFHMGDNRFTVKDTAEAVTFLRGVKMGKSL